MIKHAHKEFPSDVFVLLEGAGAKISVYDVVSDQNSIYSAAELMNVNMQQKVGLRFKLCNSMYGTCQLRSAKAVYARAGLFANTNKTETVAFLTNITMSPLQ